MQKTIGYYKKFEREIYANGTRCTVSGKLDILPSRVPFDYKDDCYRIDIVDGTLYVIKWVASKSDFEFVMASSPFIIEYFN